MAHDRPSLESGVLQHQFQLKLLRRSSTSVSSFHFQDDAPMLLPSVEHFAHLVTSFHIIGSFPWDPPADPRVLYSLPSDCESGNELIPFCFPSGARRETRFLPSRELLQSVFDGQESSGSTFLTLYAPHAPDGPFLYCLKYLVSSITLPALAHSLPLADVLSRMAPPNIDHSEICLVFRTQVPFEALFREFAAWVVTCERVARLQNCQAFEQWVAGQEVDDASIRDDRGCLGRLLPSIFERPPPNSDESFVVDVRPFPLFEWRRPISGMSHIGLARAAFRVFFGGVSLETVVTVFAAVCLEKFIIVAHPDPVVVSQVVLALHFMIRPLRWVLGSVSLLPDSLRDLLHAPQPMIVGATAPLPQMQPAHVFVDLAQDQVVTGEIFPQYPNRRAMLREMSAVTGKGKALTDAGLNRLMMAMNLAVQDMLAPIGACIVAEIGEAQNTRSKFFPELYLRQAPFAQREFLSEFSHTQMFQAHVEQECRKRSDRLCPQMPSMLV